MHTTEYHFNRPVSACRLEARLRPRQMDGQKCDHFQIVTQPLSDDQHSVLDFLGNPVDYLLIQSELQRLLISAISTVEIKRLAAVPEVASIPWQNAVSENARHPDRQLFCQATALVPIGGKLSDYARALFVQDKPLLMAVADLSDQIHRDLRFKAGITDVSTPASTVLDRRQGVCQDFTHLALACLRSLGLSARYVSGYVHTAAFRGKAHRIAQDASHAWFEIHDPQCGWVGVDPTNGRRVDDRYVVVAWGRDYDDICPLRGTFAGGTTQSLHVSVDVQEISG